MDALKAADEAIAPELLIIVPKIALADDDNNAEKGPFP